MFRNCLAISSDAGKLPPPLLRMSSTATPASGYDSYFGDSCVDASGAAENDLCPFGHYCLLGSIAPFACPPGTIGASQGLENITQCTECPMGFYCPQEGQYQASLGCTPGYFCPGGDVDPALKDACTACTVRIVGRMNGVPALCIATRIFSFSTSMS
mgnify:CR=1 FL=1